MKICEAGRTSGCCRNPDIRTINTMGADTAGNFEIRAGAGVGITTETNGIRIAYTGGIITYTNTDGNLDIDNANFTIDLANDIAISGDMVIAGDLTVNGTYYTIHAEHVYTEDDYIIMRDGAVTGLGSGDFSGFQVKLYDGVNDGRLVIDNSGTARVGDVGDEQPLMTRDENAYLTNGDLLQWDGTNSKAVDAGKKISDLVEGSGNIGSDTYPVKIVNGVATASTRGVPRAISGTTSSITTAAGTGSTYTQTISGFTGTPVISIVPNGLPPGIGDMVWAITAITNTSFTISLYNLGASSATLSFYYTVIGV